MPTDGQEILRLVVVVAGTYLLHSTILLTSAWLVVRLGQVRSHALTERVWKTAAVLGLVTAPVQLALGWSSPIFDVTLARREDVPRTTSSAAGSGESAKQPSDAARSPAGAGGTVELAAALGRDGNGYRGYGAESGLSEGAFARLPDGQSSRRICALAGPPERDLPHLPGSVESARGNRSYTGLALAGALVVAGCVGGGLGMLIIQTLLFFRRCSGARPISGGPVRRTLDRLLKRNSIRRPVRLVSSDAFDGPVAYGLVRWTVVLPEGMARRLGRDELEALLAHELAHLVRGDVLWLWTGRLLCTCLAMQPLNFLARRRWQHAAEFLCDDWAVRRGPSPLSLARCLTRLAQWRLEARECAAGLAAGGSSAKIVLRVERLVNASGRVDLWTSPFRRGLLWVAALVVTALLVGFAPRVGFAAHSPSPQDGDAGERSGPSESIGEWTLLDEELRQLDRELSYVFQLLDDTAHEPEVYESVEQMRRHATSLRQRRHALAARLQEEAER
jgi:hypothetical protein